MNDIISMDKPKTMNSKWIVYWSPSSKKLEGVKQGKAIITKAQKLNELDLIEQVSENIFKIKPIPGYNKTFYCVTNKDGYKCNCQFYNTISKTWEEPSCSHIQAVKFYLEIKKWNN